MNPPEASDKQPTLALDAPAPSAVTPPPVVEVKPVVADAPPALAETQGDAVESWLAEHPETPAAPESTEAPPVVEGEVPDKVADIPAPEKTEKPVTQAEAPDKAPDISADKVVPAEAAPVVRTYASDEKFALAANPDGSANEWTREQIVAHVQEAVANRPKAAAADKFQQVFGMDADTAEREWRPVLERLATEPQTASLIEAVFGADPAKAEYLERANAHYEAERAAGNVPAAAAPQQPAQAAPAKLAPELEQRLSRMDQFLERQALAEATTLFNRQYSDAVARYPFLANDDGLRRELLETANMLHEIDKQKGIPEAQRRGLPEAVAAKASIYDALLTARAAQGAPAPVEVPVTATLGAGAATPETRARDDGRPKIFRNGEDPTEEWLRTHPE